MHTPLRSASLSPLCLTDSDTHTQHTHAPQDMTNAGMDRCRPQLTPVSKEPPQHCAYTPSPNAAPHVRAPTRTLSPARVHIPINSSRQLGGGARANNQRGVPPTRRRRDHPRHAHRHRRLFAGPPPSSSRLDPPSSLLHSVVQHPSPLQSNRYAWHETVLCWYPRSLALTPALTPLPCRQPHRGRSASLVRSLLRVSRDKGSGWLPACVGESLPILVRSSASPQLNTPPGGTCRVRI